MNAHGLVKSPVCRVDFLNHLSGRKYPKHPVVSSTIGFVIVNASTRGISSNVGVVAFKPTDFSQIGFIGDVGGVGGAEGVGGLNVNHSQVGGPLRSHLQQQIR